MLYAVAASWLVRLGLLIRISRGIRRTASKERDRIANLREEGLLEEERETRRDNLYRLELILSLASTDPKEVAVLTLISP